MKTLQFLTGVSATLAIGLLLNQGSFAESPIVTIRSPLKPDPLILNGTSGGALASNCGNISATPSQVIQIENTLNYLRLTVKSEGQPTLLIDGPAGRFCVMADSYSGGKAELSGYWQAGKYSIAVGEVSNKRYPYNLLISQMKK